MTMKRLIHIFSAAALISMSAASCDRFLDVMPDNRAEIDSEEKVIALNTSAYPDKTFVTVTELLSDNIDNFSISYTGTMRFLDQLWNWEDVTEEDSEDPEKLWGAYYMAIANANQSILSVKEHEMEMTEGLKQAIAEATLCRAYSHFMLVNLFCQAYNEKTKTTDLGIPYLTEPETQLNPKYDRGTVAEVYEKIQADIEEALPNIGDANYRIPKYHFNSKAAYAFAARFYTYTGQWEKAVAAADVCLGTNPASRLRNWKELGSNPSSSEYDVMKYLYIDANVPANLLLTAAWSRAGIIFGPYSRYSMYSHGALIANTEDYFAGMPWGKVSESDYNYAPKVYQGSMDRVCIWNVPYLMELTDPVNQIGYPRTVHPAFFIEETLLNRVEANIMLKRYDEAVKDLNLWAANTFKSSKPFTKEDIVKFINGTAYYTWMTPTIKKHINPVFEIDEEGSDQEAMIQFLLYIRKIEFNGLGYRWFDIKRFGIEIERRMISENGDVAEVTDVLTANDPRRAIQIPLKVRSAGLAGNPR